MSGRAGDSSRWQVLMDLDYPEDYPTDEALTTLYDEIDFHRV